jgi:DNA-binding transcriptional regulator YiaG
MDHPDNIPDWKPITIRNAKKSSSKPVSGISGVSEMKKIEEAEYIAPFSLSHVQTQEIIQLRTAKGLTRKQLAAAMSITVSDIEKVEMNRLTNKKTYERIKAFLKK